MNLCKKELEAILSGLENNIDMLSSLPKDAKYPNVQRDELLATSKALYAKMKKDPRWKQKTPKDQLVVIQNSYHGDLENYDAGIITTEKMTERINDHRKQRDAIMFYIEHPDLW